MPNAIALRPDFDASSLRGLARGSKDAAQARRLLSLAVIYDGGSRTEAARLGNVTLQIVRDWVLRFNVEGPDGLRDRKAPGPTPRLNAAHRGALLEMVERGPMPDVHGVVRSHCNTEAMGLYLAEIAAMVSPGRHAVLLLDQAGWHLSAALSVPPNITLLPLPARSPELNPVENLWQFIRENWLGNRIYASYEAILDHCCDAWNKLIDQPWRIMSIGLRAWAHEF